MRTLLAAVFASAALAQAPPAVLSQAQIQQLEAKVAANPSDLASQALLGRNYGYVILGVTALGSYQSVEGFDPALVRGDFARHAREALEKSSLPTVVGEAGQVLWNGATGVMTYQTMKRVSDPIDANEFRTLAVQSLDRAISLDPRNDRWRALRITVAVFRSNFQNFMPLSAAGAYAMVKTDLSAIKGSSRAMALGDAAKLAVKASALDDARADARELASGTGPNWSWNEGNAAFTSNMVLGEVALRQGDKPAAVKYLLASGKTKGSPQLDSFGPNMQLAKDLLEAGERDAVLAFIDECRRFWKLGNMQLQRWTRDIQEGRTPDFGANLLF
jgi:hypothetical protein